jgi:hypothetical protein
MASKLIRVGLLGMRVYFRNGIELRKAQSSFEFIATIVILLVVGLGFLVFLQLNLNYISDQNSYDEMRNIAREYATIFETANSLKSGFKQELDFSKFHSLAYNVSFLNGTAIRIVDVRGLEYVQYLSPVHFFTDYACSGGHGLHTFEKQFDEFKVCCGSCESSQIYCALNGVVSSCNALKHARSNVSFVVSCPFDTLEPMKWSKLTVVNDSSTNEIYSFGSPSDATSYGFSYLNATYWQTLNVTLSNHDFTVSYECENSTASWSAFETLYFES